MTVKELEALGGVYILDLNIISFEIYVDCNDNGRKFIFIKSHFDDIDITDSDDRVKQFLSVESAIKHCLLISKKFSKELLIQVENNLYQAEKNEKHY